MNFVLMKREEKKFEFHFSARKDYTTYLRLVDLKSE